MSRPCCQRTIIGTKSILPPPSKINQHSSQMPAICPKFSVKKLSQNTIEYELAHKAIDVCHCAENCEFCVCNNKTIPVDQKPLICPCGCSSSSVKPARLLYPFPFPPYYPISPIIYPFPPLAPYLPYTYLSRYDYDYYSLTIPVDDPPPTVVPPNPQPIPPVHPNINANHVYIPSQIISAYGLNNINVPSGHFGEGITVAVIVAYRCPSVQTDLDVFSSHFNLPLTQLDIYQMSENTRIDAGWSLEECMDVQMVHMIAPYATIMVVEAESESFTDLMLAITYATNNGANIVSMSFGSAEFAQERSYDAIFSNPSVCYVASAGDTPATVEYPSACKSVLSVGGTSLYLTSTNKRSNETTWNSGGCGTSKYILAPTYQSDIATKYRQTCDISFVGNPQTGIFMYHKGQWWSGGGTSVSAPCIAGILAIADQLRAIVGKPMLTTVDNKPNSVQMCMYKTIYTTPTIYNACFNDVLIGVDGKFTAKVGYDLPTGLGSPKADGLCAQLAAF